MVSIQQGEDIIQHINALSENQVELHKTFDDITKRIDEMNKKLEKVSNDCEVIALNTESMAEFQSDLNDAFNRLRSRFLEEERWKKFMQIRKEQMILPPEEYDEEDDEYEYDSDEDVNAHKTPRIEELEENKPIQPSATGGNGVFIQKPYSCPKCGNRFAYPHTMKYHMENNCRQRKGVGGCGRKK